MSERISSGSKRLDAILGGGLMRNGINVIMGLPGTGKTILGQQYLFHNAGQEAPSLYLSTVSEPLEKILRYGQSLSFFDSDSVGSSVFYEDLGPVLTQGGLPEVLEHVSALLMERRPAVLVVDSFKAMRPFAQHDGDFRRFLHELAGRLSAFPVTTFWLGEYGSDEIAIAPEFAVADAIVALSTERTAEREMRVLQVLKLRGSAFQPGKHSYRLSSEGVDAFPRLADPANQAAYELPTRRISSGIPILDEMLADGYFPGASTLIAGPSGAGKTLMGLHFVSSGAEAGEPGIIATLQENPWQLQRIGDGFGLALQRPEIEMMYRTGVDIHLDEWVHELLEMIERIEARRVMIDSLGDLRAAALDETRLREFVYSLLQRLSRQGVSVMMMQEVTELFGVTRLSEYGISHFSDNVVLLQFLRGDSQLKRAITVMKTRGSAHDARIREFDITPAGFALGEQFSTDQSLA